ncbi:MAG: class I SAM-dependent methyltransferase [Actinomycetota bacterium]
MLDTTSHFDRLYESQGRAFGCQPDPELLAALAHVQSGRVVDLGGGQGRHCLPLARMGLEVEVVDISERALRQVTQEATREGLEISGVCSDVVRYEPPSEVRAIVAALLLHLPAVHLSVRVAERLGSALGEGGLFYLSLPGFDEERVRFAGRILHSAGCVDHRVVNHVVTRRERPRLPVPRRNETRAVGFKR